MKNSYLVYIIRDKVENLYEKQYSENVHCSEGTKSLLHRHNYICTFTIHYFENFIPVDLESKQLQIYPCDYLLERASGGSHKPGHVFLPLFLGPNCDSSMC